MNNTYLDISGLHFQAGDFCLREVAFSCRRGEYHILLGPTGSGKTSLIKCILGINRPRGGAILLDGRDLTGLPPEKRRLGYLPQNYALFPHLTVEGNIRFGLFARRLPAGEAERLLRRQCAALGIENLRERNVRTLSGGEQQKVALARALIAEPEVILLDEPFSAIDEGSRRLLWFELKQAIGQAGVTAVHITHNLEEAYTLGDKLSVLIDGRLVQSGLKEDIFQHPSSERIARFLGYRNIFSGSARPVPGGTEIDLGHFRITVGEPIAFGSRVSVCVRQQDIKVIREDAPLRESLRRNVFTGTIVSLFMLPEHCLMRFRIDGSPGPFDFELKFPVYIRQRLDLAAGGKVRVAFWEPSIIIFRQ